jgi:hypothetical protein
VPDLSHLWQRFLIASALLIGLAVGVAATVFGYSNLQTVDVHWSVLRLDGVPLWTVPVVPIALLLVAGTVYHWMDSLHHFTEHMRHRRRVHELEAEVAILRAHLDQVLEMPDAAASEFGAPAPAKHAAPISLPAANVATADLASAELAKPADRRPGGERRKRARLIAASELGASASNGDEAEPVAGKPEPTESAPAASSTTEAAPDA